MSDYQVTEESLREAQMAAHMAAHPTVLPSPSVYFQDFTFGKTMFEAAFGNAEALAGVGEAISDVAIDNRLRLEAEERKKDDPATDASMITDGLSPRFLPFVSRAFGHFDAHCWA